MSERNATRLLFDDGCKEGRHVPSDRRVLDSSGCLRTKCRHCGCTLLRLQASRSWYFSGELG